MKKNWTLIKNFVCGLGFVLATSEVAFSAATIPMSEWPFRPRCPAKPPVDSSVVVASVVGPTILLERCRLNVILPYIQHLCDPHGAVVGSKLVWGSFPVQVSLDPEMCQVGEQFIGAYSAANPGLPQFTITGRVANE